MRKKFLLFTAVLVLVAIGAWVYLPIVTKYRELRIQEQEITAKIESLDAKILALQEERELLKHDVAYIEKVIRDELGLVKPGETIYKFVAEEQKEAQTVLNSTE